MRVRLTPSAEYDLEEVESHIAEHNPTAAIATVLHILSSLQHLGDHNEIGRPGRVQDAREWVIADTPFIAAYRIRADTV